MSAREVEELKLQGVIEAAQNPESQVSAEDAERELVSRARNAGIPAFQFDPDASPEQKRAQTKAVMPDAQPPPPPRPLLTSAPLLGNSP
ncbi:hypothetical protein B0I35DRAFT_419788 [Stachybotrys elegans]|uniref:Uncharacterized protein n=1 Tax=Stachybotrys elegans TaxID=80388 RepID=A0A8K0WY86_9HYPO|nr:hypothetical protein B0I35DRAFT_419788 [Stachybotrys elegans]